ncbi:MAG: sulfatase [Bacteroidetes bacterium]|nr:sulfatase [Bacteroidota bacterium]
MKSKFSLIILFTTIFFAGISISSAKEQSEKPNFLFILVDDLGYMDIGCNNSATFYETPNIDKLASEGVRFTNAYAACPVCSPTRSSILTGKYPARTDNTAHFGAPQPYESKRVQNKPLLPAQYVDYMDLNEITLAEAMLEGGYNTFFAGKWHLGGKGFWPENQGFEINKGGWTKGGPYGGKKYFSPYENPNLEDGPEGEHLPDRLATETINFIKNSNNKPFFAYLSFYSVHTPLIGRPDLVEKYKKKKLEANLPKTIWGKEEDRKLRLVQENAVYAAMVEAMDLAVGRVLNELKQLNLDKNTIVIFMSDNGGLSTSEGHPTSNLPLRAGKGWLYEGGIREPMIIKWPGESAAGKIENTPVTSTDFYPTILEIAGLPLKPNQHIDGVSLATLLKKGKAPKREALYWHYPHYGNQGGTPGAAIRKEDFKLIEYFNDKPTELFNLKTDLGETKNLAESMPKKVDELKTLLHNWQKETDAKFTSPNVNYKK